MCWWLAEDQKVKFANQAAMKILGANHGSMIGKTISFSSADFAQNFIRGHVQQHVIFFDDKKEAYYRSAARYSGSMAVLNGLPISRIRRPTSGAAAGWPAD